MESKLFTINYRESIVYSNMYHKFISSTELYDTYYLVKDNIQYSMYSIIIYNNQPNILHEYMQGNSIILHKCKKKGIK